MKVNVVSQFNSVITAKGSGKGLLFTGCKLVQKNNIIDINSFFDCRCSP